MSAIFICDSCDARAIVPEVEHDDIVDYLLPVGWGIDGNKICCRHCR